MRLMKNNKFEKSGGEWTASPPSSTSSNLYIIHPKSCFFLFPSFLDLRNKPFSLKEVDD